MPADPGFTLITATLLKDAKGNPLANGTLTFTPGTSSGVPASFALANSLGTIFKKPVTYPVQNGVLMPGSDGKPPQLADTSLTIPIHMAYSCALVDTSDYTQLLGEGYEAFQPTGQTVAFDQFDPDLSKQVTVQRGPTGVGANYIPTAGEISTVSGVRSFIFDFSGSNPTTVIVINIADGEFITADKLSFTGMYDGMPLEIRLNFGSNNCGITLPTDSSPGHVFFANGETAYIAAAGSSIVAGLILVVRWQWVGFAFVAVRDPSAADGVSSAQLNAAIQAALTGTSTAPTASVNLLDYTAMIPGAVINPLTGAVTTGVAGFTATALMLLPAGYTDTKFLSNGLLGGASGFPAGVAFFSSPTVYASGYPMNPTDQLNVDDTAPATPHTLPLGMYGFRCYFKDSEQPIPYSQMMVVKGTALPSGYVPPGTTGGGSTGGIAGEVAAATTTANTALSTANNAQSAAAAAQATANAAVSSSSKPLTGVKFFVFGDSISSQFGTVWQNAVATITGATFQGNRAEPGRVGYEIFSEYTAGNGATPNFAQLQTDLAGVGIIPIFLGTNDATILGGSYITIGSITDTPFVPINNQDNDRRPQTYPHSFYSYMMGALDQIQQLAPLAKIVLITPYHRDRAVGAPLQSGFFDNTATDGLTDQIVTALKAIGYSRGFQVCDLAGKSNFNKNTVLTASGGALLTRDGLHPSDNYGYPDISRQIALTMTQAY